jgi:hypothetical protein
VLILSTARTNSLVNTSIQSVVPNHLRGRVMAVFIMSFMGLMPISAAIFGPLGQVIGPTNAIGGGADGCAQPLRRFAALRHGLTPHLID